MSNIQENFSLAPLNTFHIDVRARYYTSVDSVESLQSLIRSDLFKKEKKLILGGGSNVLFTQDFDGLVMRMNIKGISTEEQTEDEITITAGGGEVWHELVMHCVNQNWGGIENMSLIPGTAGAAPIQNIGAYGVEFKDVAKKVQCIDTRTGQIRDFTNAECRFGYRESVFKHELKEKYFISSVTLRLTKKNHVIRTDYGAIREVLSSRGIDHPTIRDVSDAVIEIRKSKLPDPLVTGNAGSFFKNPTITTDHFNLLKKAYPEIPGYASVNQEVKVPAAWLIEQCGWKGKTFHNIGVHKSQPLVLVNYGGGSGAEILALSKEIQRSVEEKFSIQLSTEVNIF